MRKLIAPGVVLLLFFLSLLLGSIQFVKAASTYTWIDEPSLSFKKASDASPADLPTSLYGAGNVDCSIAFDNNCAISTEYGSVYNSSLNVNGKWIPIKDFGSNAANFYAIPNSSTSITASFSPTFGANLYFTHSTYPSLSPVYIIPAGTPIGGINDRILSYFKLNHPPDTKLADKTGKKLAADLSSMGFSGNSEWMVVTSPNLATLRVNVTNGAVLPFGKAFTYGFGLNPVPKNAISSSGRYAVIATPDASTFTIYDLSNCDVAPESIVRPVNCQSRDLIKTGYISSQIPGFSGVQYIRFIDERSLIFFATYNQNGVKKIGKYILSLDPDATSQVQYMALGDSYISGEGAFSYLEGTDTHDNRCHVSDKSYTALISRELNFDSYHSVSCSGATTKDIIDTSDEYKGQSAPHYTRAYLEQNSLIEPVLANFNVGYIDQLDFVTRYHPKIINLSIGGNDMGFSKVLQNCVAIRRTNTCYESYEDRLELIRLINNEVYPKLVTTYKALKQAESADTKIYVIGYPQIAKSGGNCAINVHLNADEITFSEQLIDYLDSVIQLAAEKSGVYYIDARDALYGHRLCEAGPGQVAVNGLTAGNDTPNKFFGPIGDESYHPNQLGYRLLANKILTATNNFESLMPAANPNAPTPSEANLSILNVPATGALIKNLVYAPEISKDVVYRGDNLGIDISGADYSLVSGTTFRAELHSSPIALGSFSTSFGGNLVAQLFIPKDTPIGYHTIHFFGSDVAGRSIDIYKYLYVGGTTDDIDGNGVLDSEQKCLLVEASNQDFDGDGIDDACDGFIGSALAAKTEILTSQGQKDLQTQNQAKAISPRTDFADAQTSSKSRVLGESMGNPYMSGALPKINAQGKTNLPVLIVGISILVFVVSVMAVKLL